MLQLLPLVPQVCLRGGLFAHVSLPSHFCAAGDVALLQLREPSLSCRPLHFRLVCSLIFLCNYKHPA